MFGYFSHLFMGIVALISGATSHLATNTPSAFTDQIHQSTTATTSQQTTLTQSQLLAMAGNIYASGNLPLGDNKYTTTTPQVGYVYLCNVRTSNQPAGAQVAGSWIHGSTWNISQKISVAGQVTWPNAQFSNQVTGDTRTLSGNDLPTHTTGTFPIASSDPAYTYDRNPNSIKTQSFTDNLPVNPTYSDTPYCMGGEAGIMLTGVALFNGFDEGYRDAAAYEVQDSCNGHPQKDGEYHYHSLSSCINNIDETNVIGYALDGFPITGPKLGTNKYLTTQNLDECHGITSEVVINNKPTVTYHYVMTQDFPYSVSCFRGKPVSLQVLHASSGSQIGGQQGGPTGGPQNGQNNQQNGQHPQPPQAAFTACSGHTSGSSCSFTGPNGTISGTCQTPPEQSSVVCVPSHGQQGAPGMQPAGY